MEVAILSHKVSNHRNLIPAFLNYTQFVYGHCYFIYFTNLFKSNIDFNRIYFNKSHFEIQGFIIQF